MEMLKLTLKSIINSSKNGELALFAIKKEYCRHEFEDIDKRLKILGISTLEEFLDRYEDTFLIRTDTPIPMVRLKDEHCDHISVMNKELK